MSKGKESEMTALSSKAKDDLVVEDEHEVKEVPCSTMGVLFFVLGMISGTFSALLCKMAYDSRSYGLNGEEKLFAKPIMMLLLMFTAMCPAGLLYIILQACTPVAKRDKIALSTMCILIIPSICDLLCTLLLLVAQLYITASLWQLMRGSVIIITALLKKFVLGHRLQSHMWSGVLIITSAMILVGSTSFFIPTDASATHSDKDPRIGVMLVIIGCLAQGVQYVFEEKVLSIGAPPLVVIGCEGIWGAVLTLVLVYPMAYYMPGSDNGSFEDPWDAIDMMKNSKNLQMLTIGFVLTVTVYNCAAIYVTKYLSAIWHAILDNFRPVTIWGLDLLLYYVIFPGQGYGETWTDASWLQLSGLLVLFVGTAVYNGSCNRRTDYAPLDGYNGLITTSANMSSPALTRSPLVYNKQQQSGSGEAAKLVTGKQKAKYSNEV